MLANEASFDALFCDIFETPRYTMFYNSYFSEDTVFNHSRINGEILNSKENRSEEYEEIFDNIRSEAKKRRVPPSIFVESFWRNSAEVVKSAVDFGYVISGGMELHAKEVVHGKSEFLYNVVETKDFELWNDIFMRSYGIDISWKRELLSREKLFQKEPSAHLFLARENNEKSDVAGCILLHRAPRDWMGVYCVGTLPGKRNRGVAKEMMKWAELFASEAGCNYLTLQTITSDGVAPLYQSIGFKIEFKRDVLTSLNR